LRVQEVALLTVEAIDSRSRQLYVFSGKGNKGRVVYLSDDAQTALEQYMKKRRLSKQRKVFLSTKGAVDWNADISSWNPKENRILCTED